GETLERAREAYKNRACQRRADDRRNRERELENRTLDFKRKYEDMQRDLKRTDGELTSGIIEQLYGIVSDYGKAQGYTMVLEASSGLLYADKALDITDAIVKIQNSGRPQQPAAKPGGAATPPTLPLPSLPTPKE